MKTKYAILAGLALAAAATPAQAEQWWLVSQARDFAGFVDVDSISEWGDERTATLRRIEYRLGPNGEKSHIVRARWHCRDRVMTVISSKTYDEDGAEMGDFKAAYPEQQPERVGKGSIGRAELDFVCENRSRTDRFARRAETDLQEAADKAFRLRRLGLTFTDAYALTLTDPQSGNYRALFAERVPGRKREAAARILGLEEPGDGNISHID